MHLHGAQTQEREQGGNDYDPTDDRHDGIQKFHKKTTCAWADVN